MHEKIRILREQVEQWSVRNQQLGHRPRKARTSLWIDFSLKELDGQGTHETMILHSVHSQRTRGIRKTPRIILRL